MGQEKEVGGPPSFPLFNFFDLLAFYLIGNAEFRVLLEEAVDYELEVVWHDENGFCFPVIFGEPLFVQIIVKDAFYAVIIL